MVDAILLIVPDGLGERVAEGLRKGLEQTVELVETRRAALAALKYGEYGLVLLDEAVAQADVEGTEALYASAGAAPVVELNFALAGMERILRQVKSALARRVHDELQARVAATAALKSELNSSLSGLLLEAQLALRGATGEQEVKLRRVVGLAGEMRDRLRTG